ncbi:MurR/RpiR family transcriptional regulator [Rhizobium sp. DKSPLA3]|uniref:MurR/RpiR family transcriptional regulator n=1 Tax=Rhizobium quercicola TaxID=2901226 RepID=A0A9X1T2W1_9HYPH|nr:MurR/RpiR family transcriptional regulator [Rhizobium quercicola]MCD7111474.1 MurR/RpiR family transcriptional regulator [Rhizobium quercicola]
MAEDAYGPLPGEVAHEDTAAAFPPGDFNELRRVVAAKHPTLPKRLARVARQILDYPVDVAFGSVATVAMAAQVAPSTLVRFAQLFGYDGFGPLQEVVQQAVRGKLMSRLDTSPVAAEFEGAVTGKRLLNDAVAATHLSLDNMIDDITMPDIVTATRILAGANCIFVLAGPGMLPIASFLRNCLSSFDIRAVLVERGRDCGVLQFAAVGDAVVAIDLSSSVEIMSDVRRFTDLGLPLIVMTESEVSPLADVAEVRFRVIEPGEAGLFRIAAGIALCEVLVRAINYQRQGGPL